MVLYIGTLDKLATSPGRSGFFGWIKFILALFVENNLLIFLTSTTGFREKMIKVFNTGAQGKLVMRHGRNVFGS